MTLLVESLGATLRFVSPGDVYGDPFKAVATVTYCGDLVFLSAMHGTMTRQFLRELQAELLARGVVDALVFRHGKREWIDVASGRVVVRGERFPALAY